MEKKLLNYVKVFLILTFISILLLMALLLWDVVFVAHTPSYIVPSAPTSGLEIRVQNLEMGLQNLQRDLIFQLNQKLYWFGGIAFAISILAAFFGWRTFKDLDGLIQEKIRATLEKQLYQLDITNQRIWVISNEKTREAMDEVAERLELSGLSYYKTVDKLDSHSFTGVSIVPVFDDEMLNDFIEYLKRNQAELSAKKAAFVLYTKRYHINEEIPFANYTFANMPVTAVSHLLTVGRGLNIPPKAKKAKQEG